MGERNLAVCLCLFLFIGLGGVVKGYYSDNACYFCHDTGENPDCQDYKVLKKASLKQDDKHAHLLRNCSATDQYCMIERFIKLGQKFSYIRDCSDGLNHSFSAGLPGRTQRLKHDNFTTCTFDLTMMGQICITLCEGQFCNGPQNAATGGHQGTPYYLLSMMPVFVLLIFDKKQTL